MKIIEQLSSQVGDRTQESNQRVTAICIANPALLEDVAEGRQSKEAALLGDCCEVMTKVAEQQSELILPYRLVGTLTVPQSD